MCLCVWKRIIVHRFWGAKKCWLTTPFFKSEFIRKCQEMTTFLKHVSLSQYSLTFPSAGGRVRRLQSECFNICKCETTGYFEGEIFQPYLWKQTWTFLMRCQDNFQRSLWQHKWRFLTRRWFHLLPCWCQKNQEIKNMSFLDPYQVDFSYRNAKCQHIRCLQQYAFPTCVLANGLITTSGYTFLLLFFLCLTLVTWSSLCLLFWMPFHWL